MCLKNVLSLSRYPFLKQLKDSKISLTPLSQQIKQNISNEWIKSNRRLPSVEVFVTPLTSHVITENQINSLKSIVRNYDNYYCQHLREDTNQTIGIIDKCFSLSDKHFLNDDKNDCMVFAMFCRRRETIYWFQKLQSIQSQWFRNHSRSPLKSKFEFMFESEENETQKLSLNFKSEDQLNVKLETIEYISHSLVERDFGLTDCDLIVCNINLDNSLIAFLCDAFNEKVDRNGNTVNKMKFHPSLAPFKIAFTFRKGTEVNKISIELMNYLIHSLKLFDIPVLPFSPYKQIPIESLDELGIPFTIIVDNESTRNAVIGLRSRDSNTEESLHISRLQQTICLNLNVIHPSIVCNRY